MPSSVNATTPPRCSRRRARAARTPGTSAQPLQRVRRQLAVVREHRVHAERFEVVDRGAEADRLGDRHGAGLELPRQLVPLGAGQRAPRGSSRRRPGTAASPRAARAGPTARRCRSARASCAPVNAMKSAPSACTSTGQCGTLCEASTSTRRAGGVRLARDLGHRVDGAEHVRDVHDAHQLRRGRRRAARAARPDPARRRRVTGMKRSSMPRSAARMCHGTRFEWCSISVSTIASPAFRFARAHAYATRLMASVLLRVKTISRGMRRADERRHAAARVLVGRGRLLGDAVDAAMDVGVVASRSSGPSPPAPRPASARSRRCRGRAAACCARLAEDRELRAQSRAASNGAAAGAVGSAAGAAGSWRHPILRSITSRSCSRTLSSGMRSSTGAKNPSTISRCASPRGSPRAIR